MVAIAGQDIRRGASALTSGGIGKTLVLTLPIVRGVGTAPLPGDAGPLPGTAAPGRVPSCSRPAGTASRRPDRPQQQRLDTHRPFCGPGQQVGDVSTSDPGCVIALNDRYTNRPVARTATVSATASASVAAGPGGAPGTAPRRRRSRRYSLVTRQIAATTNAMNPDVSVAPGWAASSGRAGPAGSCPPARCSASRAGPRNPGRR